MTGWQACGSPVLFMGKREMLQPQQDPQQQQISITLPLGAWQVVLEILNTQPYGKVSTLIASIVDQANRAQMSAQRPNGGMEYQPQQDRRPDDGVP